MRLKFTHEQPRPPLTGDYANVVAWAQDAYDRGVRTNGPGDVNYFARTASLFEWAEGLQEAEDAPATVELPDHGTVSVETLVAMWEQQRATIRSFRKELADAHDRNADLRDDLFNARVEVANLREAAEEEDVLFTLDEVAEVFNQKTRAQAAMFHGTIARNIARDIADLFALTGEEREDWLTECGFTPDQIGQPD